MLLNKGLQFRLLRQTYKYCTLQDLQKRKNKHHKGGKTLNGKYNSTYQSNSMTGDCTHSITLLAQADNSSQD